MTANQHPEPAKMTAHIAIYTRVSSDTQRHRSQLPDLKRWAAAQDLPVVWYTDTYTGKTMDRPGWNDLDGEMRAGNVLKIATWKLDRLGRTTLELCRLFDELASRS
jgi:DNA invertase Pin-like site-specific DNA recombinase